MGEFKIIIRSVRFTPKADDLVEKLADACNKYNLKINGDNEITPSILLCYIYEKLSHNENRTEELHKLLQALDVKTPVGNTIDIDMTRALVRSIYD